MPNPVDEQQLDFLGELLGDAPTDESKDSETKQDDNDTNNSIKTKDEFWDLIWSWQNYVNCMNRWFQTVFPWELGAQLRTKTKEEIAKLESFHHVF